MSTTTTLNAKFISPAIVPPMTYPAHRGTGSFNHFFTPTHLSSRQLAPHALFEPAVVAVARHRQELQDCPDHHRHHEQTPHVSPPFERGESTPIGALA